MIVTFHLTKWGVCSGWISRSLLVRRRGLLLIIIFIITLHQWSPDESIEAFCKWLQATWARDAASSLENAWPCVDLHLNLCIDGIVLYLPAAPYPHLCCGQRVTVGHDPSALSSFFLPTHWSTHHPSRLCLKVGLNPVTYVLHTLFGLNKKTSARVHVFFFSPELISPVWSFWSAVSHRNPFFLASTVHILRYFTSACSGWRTVIFICGSVQSSRANIYWLWRTLKNLPNVAPGHKSDNAQI